MISLLRRFWPRKEIERLEAECQYLQNRINALEALNAQLTQLLVKPDPPFMRPVRSYWTKPLLDPSKVWCNGGY